MKKGFLCLLVIFSVSCSYHDLPVPSNKPNLKALSTSEQMLSSANNDFAFNLFRSIQSEASQDNIFISPLSVTMAMAMTMNGACDSTQQSILKLLQFGNYTPQEVDQACKDLTAMLTSMDRTVQLGLANSVWNNAHYAVRDTFATTINNYFDGTVQGLNFSDPNSVNVINSWVESKTNHLIKNIIDHTSKDEAMFLINAIYFKGNWTYQFDPSKTYSAPFYQTDGSSQSVSTMLSKGATVSYFGNQNFQLIDIPYGNQQFTMTVLMPSQNYSLNNLLETLKMDSLNQWLSKSSSLTPQLELPKFEMKWKKDLLDDLKSMGMPTTGFPYLFKENLPLEISGVIHQSYINVDETGTEAAAAIVVEIGFTSAPLPQTIKINRPFIYLIREKHTNAILFMGQMIMPSDKAN